MAKQSLTVVLKGVIYAYIVSTRWSMWIVIYKLTSQHVNVIIVTPINAVNFSGFCCKSCFGFVYKT
jgi:hypothetical protein